MPNAQLLERLESQPADGLLLLIGAYRNDPRPDKIDVGVGVFKDEWGHTPIFQAVKDAERKLLEEQTSKSYLGPEGDIGFFHLLSAIALGEHRDNGRISGLQTPGGTGALRVAAELVARAAPGTRVLAGQPTWPNHLPIFRAAGLELVLYDYFDPTTQSVLFDRTIAALEAARAGDVVLLHGCCHNPTGADLDLDQWAEVARVIETRGLLPLVDLAYQGLGDGLEADAAGMRLLLDRVPEALIAYSCDKNFGLYRERVGALFAVSRDGATAARVQSNLLALTRANWSMPPDHGAAVVRTVLDDAVLRHSWTMELDAMRGRIADIRRHLAALDPSLAPLGRQKGMFSTLPLSPDQVTGLRQDAGVYMAGSGRINVAGLTRSNVAAFAAALATVGR